MKDFSPITEVNDNDIMILDSKGTKKITMKNLIASLLTNNGILDNLSSLRTQVNGQYNQLTTLISQYQQECNQYTNNQIKNLVNGAPEELDTLLELAEAIQSNDSVMEALNESITKKADKTEVEELSGELVKKADSEEIQNQIDSLKEKIEELEESGIPGGGGGTVIGGSSLPIGSLVAYMESEAPSGFLACDGATYSAEQYPKLAEFFGVSDGDFTVPDLKGEFLRGIGTNGHANQGDGGSVGEHQDATKIKTGIFGAGVNSTDGRLFMFGDFNGGYLINGDHISMDSTGKRILFNTSSNSLDNWPNGIDYYTTRPTNTSVLWIIKCDDPEDSNLQDIDFDKIFEEVIG